MISFLFSILLVFIAHEPSSFALAMTGPGKGCDVSWGSHTSCRQNAGQPVSCNESSSRPFWMCDVPPRDMHYDLDGDLDVDLKDFWRYQRTPPYGYGMVPTGP